MGADNKTEQLVIHEAIERGWTIPDFTIKDIRDAIPSHCFRPNTFRSFAYVLHDLSIIAALAYAAYHIDDVQSQTARIALWPLYWFTQSVVGFGVWVIGHECGHQAFSSSKVINNSVGMVLHSALLVPYHSWRLSHSRHHKGTGHMDKEQVTRILFGLNRVKADSIYEAFVPPTRSKIGLPSRDKDAEGDGPHSIFTESPIPLLWDILVTVIFGWPLYLLTNLASQEYPGWASHFNPYCAIFEEHNFWDVMLSTAGVSATISILTYLGQTFGSLAVIKFYVIPYLGVNSWLVVITYLHHTHPKLPHYRDNTWNFQRGAALTVDRSFGVLDHFHHHISDTHVAHHFFSNIPHYHAKEATHYIRKALGKHYMSDMTPIAVALWKNWSECRFVEDEGDVVFYKS